MPVLPRDHVVRQFFLLPLVAIVVCFPAAARATGVDVSGAGFNTELYLGLAHLDQMNLQLAATVAFRDDNLGSLDDPWDALSDIDGRRAEESGRRFVRRFCRGLRGRRLFGLPTLPGMPDEGTDNGDPDAQTPDTLDFDPNVPMTDEPMTDVPMSWNQPSGSIWRAQDCACRPAWNVWVDGYGVGGAATGEKFFAGAAGYSTGGFDIVMSRWQTDELLLGLHGGYGQSRIKRFAPMGQADTDHVSLGLFLLRSDCAGNTLLDVTYLYHDVSTNRPTVTGNAVAQYDGHGASVSLERAVDFCLHRARVQPFAALRYTYLSQGAFAETGAGVSNLIAEDRKRGSLGGQLGMRVFLAPMCIGDWSIVPMAHARWVHEFLDTTTMVYSPSFPPTGLPSLELGRDWAVMGVGLTLARRENRSVFLNYDVHVNGCNVSHAGSGGVQWTW